MANYAEDLTIEPAKRFLDCRIKELNGNHGWEYNYFPVSEEMLKKNIELKEWQPIELDMTQWIIIMRLCKEEAIDLGADKDIENLVIKGSYSSLFDFIEKFKDTRLVFVEDNKLKLLTDQCNCAILPDGRLVAGEDKSGRFTNWIIKNSAKSKTKSEIHRTQT